jgi:phage terminase small subunit
MKKLTPKRKMFVSEYLIDLNATKAAERAGYAKKWARKEGSRLLTNVDILAEIRREAAAAFKAVGITPEMVLGGLANIAFANMKDFISIGEDGQPTINLSKLTREQAAAIAQYEVDERIGKDGHVKAKQVRLKLADKGAALVCLGKHLGLFTNKVEMPGTRVLTVAMLDEILRDEPGCICD